MRAAKILGLKEVFFLGYRDSGMPGMDANHHREAQINHPIEEVAGRVVKYIRELKPDIVITFDPIGGYKHPDHIHIHKATGLLLRTQTTLPFTPRLATLSSRRRFTFRFFQKEF
jgi:LmbE family N-acetylglucosaminyl deacetylase